MRRFTAILIGLCTIGSVGGLIPPLAQAQATTPSPETPGEAPKDRYVAEMNNLEIELREELAELTRRAELAGEGERPALREARAEFDKHAQELRKALASVTAAGAFSWEEYKPAADTAAAALEAAYRKAVAAVP